MKSAKVPPAPTRRWLINMRSWEHGLLILHSSLWVRSPQVPVSVSIPKTIWARQSPNSEDTFSRYKHNRRKPSFEDTLHGAKCNWGIPFLGTKSKSYGKALSVQTYKLRSPDELLLKLNRVSETSTKSTVEFGSKRIYLKPFQHCLEDNWAQGPCAGPKALVQNGIR